MPARSTASRHTSANRSLPAGAGHIVVRVETGGKTFSVHILSNTDESDTVTAGFGPYIA